MSSESFPARPKRRLGPWGTFFLACGLLVLPIVGILTIGFFAWRHQVAQRVKTELAKIREAGEPITPEELTEFCRLPEGVEDLTGLWVEATLPLDGEPLASDARDLPIVGQDESEIPPPGEPWPKLEAVEQLLAKYQRSLDLLHQAAKARGAARYNSDFSLGFNMPLPDLQRLRGGARMLTLEAHARAHRGDPHGAAESIHAIFMLARSLEREPIAVSQIVRLAIDGIARELLQQLLASAGFSDEDLVRLQEDLREEDYREGLHRAMLGERVITVMAIEDPGAFWDVETAPNPLLRMTQNDSLAFFLEYMRELIAGAKEPWPEALQAAHQAEDRVEQLGRAGFVTKIRHMFALLLAHPMGAVFEATARNVALNGATDAAIAVEQYRRRYGKLPERLDQIVPDFLPQVPVDPFDGQPLRYAVGDGEYRVYSVGVNRTDDGGDSEADTSGETVGRERDFVFRVGPSP